MESPIVDFARSARRWQHRWRWARRYRRKLLRADRVWVSHTKSGRTWLRVMLSHLYHQRNGIPEHLVIKHDNFKALDASIPSLYLAGDTSLPSFSALRPPTPIPWRTPVLFLVRDPRDVAVSFWFHLHKRAPATELDRKGIRPADLALPLPDFCLDPRLGVPRIIELLNRWRREAAARPGAVLLRYEDVRADPAAGLRVLADFFGCPASDAEIAAAVEFARFENMRARERAGRFAGADLRPTDVADEQSFKTRRGVVGGYRDELPPDVVAALDALVAEHLAPAFGY